MVSAGSGDVRIRLTRFERKISIVVMEVAITMTLMRDGTVTVIFNCGQCVNSRVLLP